jgi:hypothetical protein
MRSSTWAVLFTFLWLPVASAQIQPEQISVETMPDPGANWFISKTNNGGYIFDAESGEMQGLLSLSRRSPTCPAA